MHKIAYWLFILGLYFGTWHWLGADFISNAQSFLFGDYIKIWHLHIAPNLPAWNNPFILIMGGAVLLALLRNFHNVVKSIAAFFIALLIYKTAFWLLSGDSAIRPSTQFMIFGVCLLALFLPLSVFRFFYTMSLRLYRRIKS